MRCPNYVFKEFHYTPSATLANLQKKFISMFYNKYVMVQVIMFFQDYMYILKSTSL